MTLTTQTEEENWLLPIMLRKQLIADGFNDRAIQRLVRQRTLLRIRRGAYAPAEHTAALSHLGRYALTGRAVLMQAKTELSLSHGSSLVWYGAPDIGLDTKIVDVTRHDGRAGRREAGVRQHCGVLLPGDLVSRHGITLTSPTRAGLEFTTVASVESSLVQINHLLGQSLTTLPMLEERYQLMCFWPDTLTTDLVLRLADGRLESPGESRSFYLFYRCSLPLPVPQYEIRDERGNLVAILDFAWPALGKWLEFDGKVKYEKLLRPGESASDVVLREKRREDLVRRITGWSCMRMMNDDLNRGVHTGERIRRFLYDS